MTEKYAYGGSDKPLELAGSWPCDEAEAF